MVSTRSLRYKFSEGERVLCYEPDPTKAKVLYDSKVLEVIESKDKRGRRTVEYLIHFQGWNSSWDRCVSEDFVLKDTQENRQLQRDLAEKSQLQLGAYLYRKERKKRVNTTAHPGPAKRARHGRSDAGSSTSTQPDEVEPGDTDLSNGSATSSGSDSGSGSSSDSQQLLPRKPQGFKADIPIPPALRDRLTFDYHLVVKRGRLARLPASPNAAEILESYVKWFAHTGVWQATRTRHAPAQRPDILDVSCRLHLVREVAEGIRIYIDFILGDHLLYKQEQPQYWQLCGQYNEDVKPKSESEDSQEEDAAATDEENNSQKMTEYSHLPPDPVGSQNNRENETENDDENEENEAEDDEDNEEDYEEDNEEDREVENVLHNNIDNHSQESETEDDEEDEMENDAEHDESDDADNDENESLHNNVENGVNNVMQNTVDNEEDDDVHSNEENDEDVLHKNVDNVVHNGLNNNIGNEKDDAVDSNEENDEDYAVDNDAENEEDAVHNNVDNGDANVVHNNAENDENNAIPNKAENDEDDENSEEENEEDNIQQNNVENEEHEVKNNAGNSGNNVESQNEVQQNSAEDDEHNAQNEEEEDEEMDVDNMAENDEDNDGQNADEYQEENDQVKDEDEDSKSKVMESVYRGNSYNNTNSNSDPNNECEGEEVKVDVKCVKMEASSEEAEQCEDLTPRGRRCAARSGHYTRRLRSYKSNKSHSENEEQAPSTSTGGEQKPFDTQSSSVESTMSSLSEEWRGRAARAPPPAPPPLTRTPLSLLLEKVSKWRVIPRDESTQHLPCRIYGATHLARLFVKLPEFLNATNMAESKLKVILKNIDMFVQYLDEHGEWFGEMHYTSDGRSDSH
ncbi:Male-specific lethal 3-like [Papilio xuthus]|uniref:Protein male-specific lethal-3 n=1 Tax=Papilio xuthus TaxID=66420 RepID=A0A194PNA4_PAPXU|nr:Male-specific lethal 3-like [Papilio xuthus]